MGLTRHCVFSTGSEAQSKGLLQMKRTQVWETPGDNYCDAAPWQQNLDAAAPQRAGPAETLAKG